MQSSFGHFVAVDPHQFNQLFVITLCKGVIQIQHISQTAGHTGTEIESGFAQHSNYTAGHILTTVITNAFNNRNSAGITNSKAFTRFTCSIQFTTSSTI